MDDTIAPAGMHILCIASGTAQFQLHTRTRVRVRVLYKFNELHVEWLRAIDRVLTSPKRALCTLSAEACTEYS